MTPCRARASLLAPFVVVLACEPVSEPSSLDDRVFLSQSVTEDGVPRALVGSTQLRLSFRPGAEVSGSAGCNSLTGSYSIDGGTFVMPEAAQTLIGCDAARHEQEDWYFGFMLSSPSIVVDGDTLVLEGDGTRIEYLDQEVATPDTGLTGVTWTVETIIEGELARISQWSSPATLVFGDDGTVEVNTGCNGGTGTYQVAGPELTFADVGVTERGCDGDTGDLERAVLGVIHGPQPVTWEITVDRLSLRGADFGLDLRSSEG